MQQRLLYGSILIAALLALIYFDGQLAPDPPEFLRRIGLIRLDGMLVVGVILALAILGVREMVMLVRAAGRDPLSRWPVLMCVLFIAIPFIAANSTDSALPRLDASGFDGRMTLAAIVTTFIGAAVLVAARKRVEGATDTIGSTLLIILYVGLLASFLVRIRMFAPSGGAWLLLYYVGVVKSCDIGAYFTGRMAGRTKLIEWLSPKKTVEGLAGGVTFSVVVAVAVPTIVRALAEPGSPLAAQLPSSGMAVLFGVTMALVGHAGDLLESLFKREARAKDSASAVPAFGGVLDIIDSPLVTAPFAYWILI
ncbi:MAG: phosphatidate cytidylyltransferase [Phycisphaerae bacterium]|nr:phosphatidate cytidylyltransferase [Phycisphaerae bacterium]